VITPVFERLNPGGSVGLDEHEVVVAPEFDGVIVPTDVPAVKLYGLPE
jgi:hypothetical protein